MKENAKNLSGFLKTTQAAERRARQRPGKNRRGEGMRVVALKNAVASDGVEKWTLTKGEECDLPDDVAREAITQGVAREVFKVVALKNAVISDGVEKWTLKKGEECDLPDDVAREAIAQGVAREVKKGGATWSAVTCEDYGGYKIRLVPPGMFEALKDGRVENRADCLSELKEWILGALAKAAGQPATTASAPQPPVQQQELSKEKPARKKLLRHKKPLKEIRRDIKKYLVEGSCKPFLRSDNSLYAEGRNPETKKRRYHYISAYDEDVKELLRHYKIRLPQKKPS